MTASIWIWGRARRRWRAAIQEAAMWLRRSDQPLLAMFDETFEPRLGRGSADTGAKFNALNNFCLTKLNNIQLVPQEKVLVRKLFTSPKSPRR